MRVKLFLFLFLMFIILFIAGCNSESTDVNAGQETAAESAETEKETEVEDEPEESDLEAETEEIESNTDEQDSGGSEAEESETGEKESTDEKSRENKENDEKPINDEEETAHSIGDYNVFLGGEMVETEDKIIIEGESNLLPDARIIGEVSVGEDEYFADTTEPIQEDGSFYMEIPHHDFDKETKVTVKFHFDGHQEDEIIRHYGDRGKELAGPYIYKHKGEVGDGSPQNIYQMAKVETTFIPGEELAVRQFKEPDWYEIPDDMGDPRVWMEVAEITNDHEYFYLHGKSNLLEGSKLKGKYAGESDETSVKPDGSFDMMFEYEYKENEPFVIEFDPSHYSQWNIIEETYGSHGQQLVGNLVVKNPYNDNQSIIIEEQLESTEISVPDNVELEIDDTEVMMLVPDDLLFDFDEYKLKKESKNLLNEIGETLQAFDHDIEIEISGHTDDVGDEGYNQELSEKRAEEVKDFLMEQEALSEANITTFGHGETKPIVSNDTEKGQEKNRRVEIVINLK